MPLFTDPAFSSDPRAHPHFDASPLHSKTYTLTIPTSIFRSPPHLPALSRILPKSLNPPQNNVTPRKKKERMKAFVRRLTGRRNLDRIDELDETDPFGGSYHHDGPYEAIAHNVIYPTDPDPVFTRANLPHSMPEFDPRSLRLGQHNSTPWVPHAEMGLSLRLEPGQIMQPNAIYSSHASSLTHVPSRPGPQSTMATRVARPDHSRSHSLPRPWAHSPRDSSTLDLPAVSRNRPASLQAPRERHFRVITPDIPNDLDPYPAPYALRQTQISVFPPPRYESRFHNSAPPSLPQHIPSSPTSPEAQSVQSRVPLHHSRHNNVHLLDESHAIKDIVTQPSSTIRDKSLDLSRMRHVPKRLVMPSPLQPQQPQTYYNISSSEPVVRPGERLDDRGLELAHFKGEPAVQVQESRVLQKKLSTFPAKKRIPDHIPILQDPVVPITGNSASKTVTDAVEIKERTRRRKLSKRKSDI